jgi:hypothetical protein
MSEKPDIREYLKSLQSDIRKYGEHFHELVRHVLEGEITKFPLFIASGVPVEIGRPFLSKEDHDLHWNYNVSMLEEFIATGLVGHDKVEEFKKAFGDPMKKACIFLVLGDSGNFIFLPYD